MEKVSTSSTGSCKKSYSLCLFKIFGSDIASTSIYKNLQEFTRTATRIQILLC